MGSSDLPPWSGRLEDVVHVYTADHLNGGGFPEGLAAFTEAVLAGAGLHHLAHYSDNVCDFALDVLAAPATAAQLPGSVERARKSCLQVGAELGYHLLSLDRLLQQAQSGALIRIVLHTPQGAVFCNSIIPREYLVAHTLDRAVGPTAEPMSQQPLVRQADQRAATLATRVRALLSQGSQDPGGWAARQRSARAPLAPTPPAGPPVESGQAEEVLAPVCRGAVSVRDLHHVGYYRADQPVYSADLLGDPMVGRFFQRITPGARREFYTELGRQFATVVRCPLGRVVRPVIGGPLTRIVLDVEQGAIYFYRLAPGEHLLGVTLDQHRVSEADDVIAGLAVLAHQKELPGVDA